MIDAAIVDGEDDIDNREGDQIDIMDSVNEVIKNARYKSINPDWCEIPAGISVNKDLVSQLKDALVTHPDKTQVFLGVVCVTDDEDNMIGGFHVYVNPELFLALRELSLEGFSIQKNNFLPAIVHELGEHDSLDAVTLGMFLNKNSKDFSQKIRDNMKYQDLVRFCVSTISNQTKGSEVAVKDYLKLALKEFSKGRSNWSLFISLASLPASYLTKFEQFIALFERGALFGQKLSGRQLCNADKKRKRKKSLKLMIPVTMLKLHMKVEEERNCTKY